MRANPGPAVLKQDYTMNQRAVANESGRRLAFFSRVRNYFIASGRKMRPDGGTVGVLVRVGVRVGDGVAVGAASEQ